MDKLDIIIEKITSMEERIEAMDDKITAMDERIEAMDDKITAMDERIEAMDDKITAMDERIEAMDDKITTMDTDIKRIKLTLENEVRTNIMRVAEGHLDLSRKLDQAIQSNNEFEMLSIRVNMLETDVRDIKRKYVGILNFGTSIITIFLLYLSAILFNIALLLSVISSPNKYTSNLSIPRLSSNNEITEIPMSHI